MRILQRQQLARYVKAVARRGSIDLADVEPVVRRIVSDIRRNGDRALRRYASRFDGLDSRIPMLVPQDELEQAWRETATDLKEAITRAAANIRSYCEWQKPQEWRREINPGVCVGQLVRPLQSAACYVPSGRYPLPSTLLMTVIPAQVAGVDRICVVSPRPDRLTLAAAKFLGIRELYRIGGAQAIAALAYGTETIARVEKIVGPGSRYVTAAKKMVAFDCSIEFLAGPTESVIVSESGDPLWIAADLIAQAEHDPDALCIFITPSKTLAKQVQKQVERRVRANPIAAQSLSRRGAIILVESIADAVDTANLIAPEHLTAPSALVSRIKNAGSVFLNEFTPQAAGDYISGPNHVLPTGGMARVRGGLNVLDFVRLIACQKVDQAGMNLIAPAAIALAHAEGLMGHAESLRARCSHA